MEERRRCQPNLFTGRLSETNKLVHRRSAFIADGYNTLSKFKSNNKEIIFINFKKKIRCGYKRFQYAAWYAKDFAVH